MEKLLFRLGVASAWRPLVVLLAWVLVLSLAGFAALTMARGATSNYTVPGASFQEISDELKEALPEAGASSGLILLSPENGSAFSPEQEQAFENTRQEVEALSTVAAVSNPFTTQRELDTSREQVATGPSQLEQAQEQVDSGWDQLNQAKAQLPEGLSDERLAQLAPEIPAQQEQLEQAQAELDAQKAELAQGQAVLETSGDLRFVTEDNSVALVNIAFTEDIYAMSSDDREQILSFFDSLEANGLKTTYSNEIVQDVSEIAGASEIVGLMVALLVLVITLASVIAAGLPVLIALLGCGIGVGLVYASTAFFPMTATDPVLALMLGLGVGIDYALLILHRFREYLVEGQDAVTAAGNANATAGHSVLFAGLTNIIALAALTVTGVPFLGVMGLAGAFTVGIVVLVALTATPAVLGLVAHRTLSKAQKQALAEGRTLEESRAQKLARGNKGWGAFVTRHPVFMVLASLTVLAVATLPTTSLRLGLPDGSYQQEDSTAYQTYAGISENFGEGRNAMIFAKVDLPAGTDSTTAQDVAQGLKIDGVTSALTTAFSEDQQTALLALIPATGPNAEETVDLVHRLKDTIPQVEEQTGTSIGLTGQAIANIDISERISQAVPVYLAVVLALCLVLMTLVFKSIWIPLMATVGFLMSTLASFGAVVAIYQWGWLAPVFDVTNPGAILAFLPILLVGILFGLSVDYQIFIVSGMRDAYREGFSAREAVRVGYRAGGAVVTACGVIMISVFAGFIYSHLTVVRPIGFALALGVAMDAFLVRTTFIPAAMYLLGERAWWLPQPLRKILGDVRAEK